MLLSIFLFIGTKGGRIQKVSQMEEILEGANEKGVKGKR